VRPIVLLLAAALALPLFAGEFDVRAVPAWVEPLEAETSLAIARQNVRWGIYDLVNDHQVRGESNYYRIARKVLSPSGVQNASELELDFDPSFERLVIHHVDVLRGSERIDSLEPDEVRVIEKEDDSDSRIYDGERTALLFIKDVRPGDVIDYAWSVEGNNPLLAGRYTDEYDLSSGVPARRIRHRLLWPAGRPLQWRGGDPEIAMNGDTQVLVWERHDVDALDVEDEIPSWYEPWESIQVSEFASWKEVAAWADAMFVLDERSASEVKELAGKISAEHATRDARITAAIRFVQDEIRYLGIEMGRNSHEPHQPWETLDSRWGDCKDKTLLLVSLLRELGLQAYPALVNTRLEHRLAEKLPSPFLFDHVIAQVLDRGRTYWVDGTISDQGGTLATIETPSDGMALIVAPQTGGLTKIIPNAHGQTLVEQTYTTTSYAKPTLLTVKTTFTGAEADAARSQLATLSLEDYAHERINALAFDQAKIAADGLPQVTDDRVKNVIVVTEKYHVPELWSDGDWSWYPRVLGAHLTRPETMIRSMPLAFTHPLHVRQTVTFNFPEKLDLRKSTSVTETPAFRYEYSVDTNGKTVTIRQSLRSLKDSVAAKDVPEHLTKLSAIWSEIGFRLAPPGAVVPEKGDESLSDVSNWIVGGIIVVCFVGICWMLATRKSPIVLPLPSFRPGEAPASALAVARSEEIDARLAQLPCRCGGTRYSSPEFQRARYAERDLTIVTRNCGACGKEQSVYFTAA
jgi:Domain of Unknown Function with PDB structure (DUF3857)/Transglutaminase-like superfamily